MPWNAEAIRDAITASPFRHAVVDDQWPGELLRDVAGEMPDPRDERWIRYADPTFEVKLEGPSDMWGPATRELVDQMGQLAPVVAEAFELPPLELRLEGGGYHQISPGGKLAVHADFNRSDDGLYRRINLIVYLNEGWTQQDGGRLQLWDTDVPAVEIVPTFNRTVLFETSSTSFHGHPEPLPGPRPRKSFAGYYFSHEQPAGHVDDHSTVWHPRFTDPA